MIGLIGKPKLCTKFEIVYYYHYYYYYYYYYYCT